MPPLPSPLARCAASLAVLNVSRNSLASLAPLGSTCPALTYLDASHNQVKLSLGSGFGKTVTIRWGLVSGQGLTK